MNNLHSKASMHEVIVLCNRRSFSFHSAVCTDACTQSHTRTHTHTHTQMHTYLSSMLISSAQRFVAISLFRKKVTVRITIFKTYKIVALLLGEHVMVLSPVNIVSLALL